MIFNSKHLTKWIPLGEYDFGGSQYVVFVRGNTRTGELFFKSKWVNRRLSGLVNPIGSLGIDVKKQWEEIISKVQKP